MNSVIVSLSIILAIVIPVLIVFILKYNEAIEDKEKYRSEFQHMRKDYYDLLSNYYRIVKMYNALDNKSIDDKTLKLIALANDPTIPIHEAHNAAIQACKRLK